MRALTLVLAVGVALVVLGCGPKKEELPQMDPADIQPPPAATPAMPERTTATIETPPVAPPVMPKGPRRFGTGESAETPPVAPPPARSGSVTPAGAVPATYTVQKGDTLSSIARKFYGDQKMFKKIYEANKDKIKSPDNVPLGTVLTMPAK